MNIPDVVVSRDGRRAVLVQQIGDDCYRAQNRDGFYVDVVVQLRPREAHSFAQFFISGLFPYYWNSSRHLKGWEQSFDEALPEILMMALGMFLDDNEVPPLPRGSEYALQIPVNSHLSAVFQVPRSDDNALSTYTDARVYWTWKYKLGQSTFSRWEARRLGIDIEDLNDVCYPKVGLLFEQTRNGSYRPLPKHIRNFENNFGEYPSIDKLADHYDVAISFAGEQRTYVEEVATRLKDLGAKVFYDGFVDLWGKDLTVELARVFKSGARYILIFCSQEYVDKQWPNEERQHALAGRIERQDDSILLARFDPINLPGLPTSVAYIDIGKRKPYEIADLVLEKLGN